MCKSLGGKDYMTIDDVIDTFRSVGSEIKEAEASGGTSGHDRVFAIYMGDSKFFLIFENNEVLHEGILYNDPESKKYFFNASFSSEISKIYDESSIEDMFNDILICIRDKWSHVFYRDLKIQLLLK